VDRSTVVHICRTAKQGALARLGAGPAGISAQDAVHPGRRAAGGFVVWGL